MISAIKTILILLFSQYSVIWFIVDHFGFIHHVVWLYTGALFGVVIVIDNKVAKFIILNLNLLAYSLMLPCAFDNWYIYMLEGMMLVLYTAENYTFDDLIYVTSLN